MEQQDYLLSDKERVMAYLTRTDTLGATCTDIIRDPRSRDHILCVYRNTEGRTVSCPFTIGEYSEIATWAREWSQGTRIIQES